MKELIKFVVAIVFMFWLKPIGKRKKSTVKYTWLWIPSFHENNTHLKNHDSEIRHMFTELQGWCDAHVNVLRNSLGFFKYLYNNKDSFIYYLYGLWSLRYWTLRFNKSLTAAFFPVIEFTLLFSVLFSLFFRKIKKKEMKTLENENVSTETCRFLDFN